jgi:hypothetical protein
MKTPKRYVIPAADLEDAPKVRRAAQELVSPDLYDVGKQPTPPYYDRFPQFRPRPLSRRLARRRLIRGDGY